MQGISAHLLNIMVHVVAGIAAMGIGIFILAKEKGSAFHRKAGRIYIYFALVVCASAIVGGAFFRFVPMFAALTVLASYQLLSGWHVVHTKAMGPNRMDLLLTVCAAIWGGLLLKAVLAAPPSQSTSDVVVYSSLGALAFLILYDTLRWFFPKSWHATLWRYEHIYKLVSSLFAMLSAFAGNVIRFGKPTSQLAPSVIGMLAIAWFFWLNYRGKTTPRIFPQRMRRSDGPTWRN